MVYKRWYLVNPHVETVQNVYGRVCRAELWPPEDDPDFKRVLEKGSRSQFWLQSEILVRGCSKYIRKFSCEEFALKSKLRPGGFSNTAQVLLATHVLSASPNFGQAKYGKKGLAATFRPKGVCSPMYNGVLYLLWPITITLFLFKLEATSRQHCRLSICENWLSWTNTVSVSEQKIPITILIMKRGPCLATSSQSEVMLIFSQRNGCF